MIAYRKIAFMIFIISLLILAVASGLFFLWITPSLDVMATSTLIARAQSATEARLSVSATNYAATLTAKPTFTPTLTETITPTIPPTLTATITLTPSITPTLQPELSHCKATLAPRGALYVKPSRGASLVQPDGELFILARAGKTHWYLVETSGKPAWATKEDLSWKSCDVVTSALTYLTHWENDGQQVLWDDFYSGRTWLSSDNKSIDAKPQTETYVLPLDSASATKQFYPLENPFDTLQSFSFYTSYSIISIAQDGYIGIRFGESANNHYHEIRINPSCDVDVYQEDDKIFHKQALMGNNECFGGSDISLNVRLTRSLQQNPTLQIFMNKSLEYEFTLSSAYSISDIRWALNNAKIDVEYIAVLGGQ